MIQHWVINFSCSSELTILTNNIYNYILEISMQAILDLRNGNFGEETVINDIEVDDTLSLLKQLNGNTHTMLVLKRNDDVVLCIGGGSQYFVVTMTNRNSDNITLIKPSGNRSKVVEICVGGQFSDFPDSIAIDFNLAQQAVNNFFAGLEKEMIWECNV